MVSNTEYQSNSSIVRRPTLIQRSAISTFCWFTILTFKGVVASNTSESERAELIVQSDAMQLQQALHNLDLDSRVEALRHKPQEVAHSEYERRRRCLGQLTPQQERAIEALLQSTVNEIYHPIIYCMRCSYDAGEAENMQAWRDIFSLED